MEDEHWLSPRGRRVVAAISGLLVVISLVVLPNDLMEALGVVQRKVPAYYFLIAGVAGFAFVHGPSLLGPILRRRRKPELQRLIDAPAYEKSLTNRINQLQTALAESEKERRKLDWLWNRGSVPPDVAKLLPRDDATARIELARLDFALVPLSAAIENMREQICSRFYQTDKDDIGHWFPGCLTREVFGNAQRTLALLRTPKDEDPRAAFALFWHLYKDVRTWIPRAAKMQGRDVRTIPGYAEWFAADAKFFAKVNELPSIPAVNDLRMLVIRDRDSGYPAALPEPSASHIAALPSPEAAS